MKTTTLTLGLLASFLIIGMAPTATATITVDVENPSIQCQTQPFSLGPAFRDRVWSNGDCDLHAEKETGIECRNPAFGTGPLFKPSAGSRGHCDLYVRN